MPGVLPAASDRRAGQIANKKAIPKISEERKTTVGMTEPISSIKLARIFFLKTLQQPAANQYHIDNFFGMVRLGCLKFMLRYF